MNPTMNLAALVTTRELDAWLSSTSVDDETTPAPAATNVEKEQKGSSFAPRRRWRRRSSLDVGSEHSRWFGFDARTLLTVDAIAKSVGGVNQYTDAAVMVRSECSTGCNTSSTPASSIGSQNTFSGDAASSMEPESEPLHTCTTPLLRPSSSCSAPHSHNTSAGSHLPETYLGQLSRSVSCPSNNPSISRSFDSSVGKQQLFETSFHHNSQSLPAPSCTNDEQAACSDSRQTQDVSPFLKAMERSQESQDRISARAERIPSSKSIGLMRESRRSRELLIRLMRRRSASRQSSSKVTMCTEATQSPSTHSPHSSPENSRSIFRAEIGCHSSSMYPCKPNSGVGSWRRQGMHNAMIKSIIASNIEEDAMRQALIRLGQKAARSMNRMSWKPPIRDPTMKRRSYAGKYPTKQTIVWYPGEKDAFDREGAVQVELKRIAQEQLSRDGGPY